jgi:hypothetical protein
VEYLRCSQTASRVTTESRVAVIGNDATLFVCPLVGPAITVPRPFGPRVNVAPNESPVKRNTVPRPLGPLVNVSNCTDSESDRKSAERDDERRASVRPSCHSTPTCSWAPAVAFSPALGFGCDYDAQGKHGPFVTCPAPYVVGPTGGACTTTDESCRSSRLCKDLRRMPGGGIGS